MTSRRDHQVPGWRLIGIAALMLTLAGCTEQGMPTTDTEVIVAGVVIVAALACVAWAIHCMSRD